MRYCRYCGYADPPQPCPQCGREGTTESPPSHEPCAYCGARPTWPVMWSGRDIGDITIYLCALCDEGEAHALDP